MPPFYPSGIRIGTAALTTRGLKEKEMVKIAKWINEAISEVKGRELPSDKEKRREFWREFKTKAVKNKKLLEISKEVKKLSLKFPLLK
jgi:glycine hydroxymethyltransferase